MELLFLGASLLFRRIFMTSHMTLFSASKKLGEGNVGWSRNIFEWNHRTFLWDLTGQIKSYIQTILDVGLTIFFLHSQRVFDILGLGISGNIHIKQPIFFIQSQAKLICEGKHCPSIPKWFNARSRIIENKYRGWIFQFLAPAGGSNPAGQS